jgi:hypothetical protein
MTRHKEKDDEAGGEGLGVLVTSKRLWKDLNAKIVNSPRPIQNGAKRRQISRPVRKISKTSSTTNIALYEDRKKSSVPEPSFLKLPCSICDRFNNEEVTLIYDGCDHPYHTYCLELEALPPKEEKWFCPDCSGGVQPPVTEKVLSANELLP